jgi:hypothetical protein
MSYGTQGLMFVFLECDAVFAHFVARGVGRAGETVAYLLRV